MTFADLVNTFTATIVASLSTLIVSSAVLMFFYGVIQFLMAKRQGDGDGIKNGNKFMTWGLVALFVMFSVYGIIKLAQSILFNGKPMKTIDIPSFGVKSGTRSDVQIGSPASPGQPSNGSPTYTPQQPTGGGGGVQTGSYFDSSRRATDTNYSGCPSGKYDAFGGCEPATSGAYACDPQDNSCNNSGNPVESSVSSNSDALSEYIKQCKAGDSNKTSTQCWQEYSAQNPVQSTTETAPTPASDESTTKDYIVGGYCPGFHEGKFYEGTWDSNGVCQE